MATRTDIPAVPKPITAGAEMAALGRFMRDVAWTGTFALTWQLHWVARWDPIAGEYRATLADIYGHTGVVRGQLDGDRLTTYPASA